MGAAPSQLIPERYRVIREIGRGGMGVVYEVEDATTRARVALKHLHNLDGQGLYALKREFAALSEVRHPNVVRFRDLHVTESIGFFTMDYVEGVDLLTYVAADQSAPSPTPGLATTRSLSVSKERSAQADPPSSPPAQPRGETGRAPACDIDRLRDVLIQVIGTLAALHTAGIVHRDFKPSNALVTPDGEVVLLDFGLAAAAAGPAAADLGVVGTAAYMAPEQGQGESGRAPADLYAVGVFLFRALTGRFPFYGTATAVLQQKLDDAAPDPRLGSPEIPADLAGLCRDLLERAPRDRPSAAAALARLQPSREVPSGRGARPGQEPFVGREAELVQLWLAYEELSRGGPSAVIVRGEAGIGKTTLIQHFLADVVDHETRPLLLSGRCYDKGAVPFNAFDQVVDALSRFLAGGALRETLGLSPIGAAALGLVFPVLGAHLGSDEAAVTDMPSRPASVRGLAFSALWSVIRRVAAVRPIVVFLDDLQWADEDSLTLLRELFADASDIRVLLLASIRTGDPGAATAERLVERSFAGRCVSVELGGLAASEVEALLAASLQVNDERAVAHLLRETNGHPLFLREIVGTLRPVGVDGAPVAGFAQLVAQKLRRLADAPARMMKLVSLAQRPVSVHLTAAALGVDTANVTADMYALRDANLVRLFAVDGHTFIEPFHGRIADAVYEGLAAGAAALHRAFVGGLRSTGEGAPAQLVHHLIACGEPQEAAMAAVQAADRALDVLAFDKAAEHLTMALGLGVFDEAERRRLQLRRADALGNAGLGEAAADAFVQAADGGSADERRECLRRAADHLIVQGHLERGIEICARVLSDAGMTLLRSPRRALWSALRSMIALRVRGVRVRRRDRPPNEAEWTRLHALAVAGQSLIAADHVVGGAYVLLECRFALRIGAREAAARALAACGAMFASAGGEKDLRLAKRYFLVARELASDAEDPAALRVVAALAAYRHLHEGALATTHDLLGAHERWFLAQPQRDQWMLNNFALFRTGTLVVSGRLGLLAEAVAGYVDDANQRGDLFVMASIAPGIVLCWCIRDEPDTARAALDRTTWASPLAGVHLQDAQRLTAEAHLALYSGAGPGACLRLAKRLRRMARSSLVRQVRTVRIRHRYLHARLLLAAGREVALSRRQRRTIRRLTRQLGKERFEYSQLRGLIIAGAGAARQGASARAIAHLEAARDLAERLGYIAPAAALTWRLGELYGGPEGQRRIADAADRLRHEGVVNPARMVDCFAPQVHADRGRSDGRGP